MVRRILSSTAGLAAVIFVVLAVSAAGYWYRQKLLEMYSAVEQSALTALSLGLAAVAVWIVVFTAIAFAPVTPIRRPVLWASSVSMLAGVLGLLSFYEVYFGSLSWITLGGEVSLGGRVGEIIAGPPGAVAVARVAALFLVAAAAAMPSVTRLVGIGLGRFAVASYAAMVLAFGKLASSMRRKKREEPFEEPAPAVEYASSADLAALLNQSPYDNGAGEQYETWESTETLAEPSTDTNDYAYDAAGEEIEQEPAIAFEPEPILEEPVLEEPVLEEPVLEEALEPEEEPQPAPSAFQQDIWSAPDDDGQATKTRFNKYWGAEAVPQEHNQGVTHYEDVGDADEDVPPIAYPDASEWDRPAMDILHNVPEGGITQEDIDRTAQNIKTTLADYGVEVEVGETHPGPTVTMYGLIPGWIRRHKQVTVTDDDGRPVLNGQGKRTTKRVETRTRVKVEAIASREKDLSLALRTPSIRIETPALGKSLVGIEIPNPNPSLVTLRGAMEGPEYRKLRESASLPVALGKGSGGEAVVIDLAKMPHLLVAGATGSGKSVCINTILSGLIMEKTPAELRLLLIDPKRVELTPYNGIPHLLTPVVVEVDEVVGLLKGLIAEMMNRYRRMEEAGVRNISTFNKKMPDQMPYLVVAVDELADLMMTASFDVEQSLCRLAQMGRATGIHLIVATQRPSVDVVTGLIKANFPSRISFGVTSQIDSRTILDTAGAEKLLGKGDMLYQAVDAARPERVQGVFISDGEVEDLVDFWKTTPWLPLPTVALHTAGDGEIGGDHADVDDDEDRDEMFDKAIELAHTQKKLSTSLLQRRLRIGYPRAARLMDQLEEEGLIGPSDGSKSRDVIIGV
jgi:DNA segregation ATPase FtsK/SpoIIIE-like protein